MYRLLPQFGVVVAVLMLLPRPPKVVHEASDKPFRAWRPKRPPLHRNLVDLTTWFLQLENCLRHRNNHNREATALYEITGRFL